MITHDAARRKFAQLYGSEPEAVAFAPGRVNLIGEHIDYAGGTVLPIAVAQGVTVAVRTYTGDREFAAWSDIFASDKPGLFGAFAGQGHFETITARCADETSVHGAQLVVLSDLPVGRGMSSSAALCVAIASAFGATCKRSPFDGGLELARACQRTEIAATGVSCGLMDQYASVFGMAGHAVSFNTSTYSHTTVPLPAGMSLLVVDSGISRQLSATQYNRRREELEMAFAAISRELGHGSLLTDFEPADLEREAQNLPNPFKRRMRHVLSEQQRVREFSQAMQAGDLRQMGQLLNACHHSLSEDYEVSLPEIDLLASEIRACDGVAGVRMIGGGFGGAVLVIGEELHENTFADALEAYEKRTGNVSHITAVEAEDGAQVWAAGGHKLASEWFS